MGAWFRRAVRISCLTGGSMLEQSYFPAVLPSRTEIRAEPTPSDDQIVQSEPWDESDELVIEGVDPSILRRALGARLPTIYEVDGEGEDSDEEETVPAGVSSDELTLVGEIVPAGISSDEAALPSNEIVPAGISSDEATLCGEMAIDGLDPAILRPALGAGEDSDVELAGRMTLWDYLMMEAA